MLNIMRRARGGSLKVRGRFTLLELMAVMVVLVILLGALLQFMNMSRRMWQQAAVRTDSYTDARVATDFMKNLFDTRVVARNSMLKDDGTINDNPSWRVFGRYTKSLMGNNLEFYTNTNKFGDSSGLNFIQIFLDENDLKIYHKPVDAASADLSTRQGNLGTADTIISGVIDFTPTFYRRNGSNFESFNPNGSPYDLNDASYMHLTMTLLRADDYKEYKKLTDRDAGGVSTSSEQAKDFLASRKLTFTTLFYFGDRNDNIYDF